MAEQQGEARLLPRATLAPESHQGQKELLRLHPCRPTLAEASQKKRFRSCRETWTHEYIAIEETLPAARC